MKDKLLKGDHVPFTQVANSVLSDSKLSFKAKGLWAYLYSKPEDWDFHGDRIALDTSDGRKVIYSALKELEETGYLTRERQADGRMDYTIRFKPVAQKGQEGTKEKPLARFGKEPKGATAPIDNNIDKKAKKTALEKGNAEKSVWPSDDLSTAERVARDLARERAKDALIEKGVLPPRKVIPTK